MGSCGNLHGCNYSASLLVHSILVLIDFKQSIISNKKDDTLRVLSFLYGCTTINGLGIPLEFVYTIDTSL